MRQVVLDTETTGLDIANDHRIIEIAGVELVNRKLTKNSYQIYLNPERAVGQSFKIHGLTDDFLSDKPLFKDVYQDFLNFIKDSELLIHNAEFDIGFLNHELKLADLDIKIEDYVSKITDTLSIAREKHPGQRNSLEVLTDRYQITGYDRSYHGALIDSEILADVYLAMTGGQRDLGFDDNASKDFHSKFENDSSNNLNLIKIQVSEDDNNLHNRYLSSLKIDHGNN
ncbi:MAG: DNA polymerase III subunit epsilon [Gammaproteobacteria bacterium]|nr:MAG: DNA polymerase III subunit epsilon [Gammaproteobacteria bacterium]